MYMIMCLCVCERHGGVSLFFFFTSLFKMRRLWRTCQRLVHNVPVLESAGRDGVLHFNAARSRPLFFTNTINVSDNRFRE